MSRLEEIATFVEIANCSSISEAAKRLGISKSMASRRLHALEERLHTQLIARTTRTLRLTDNGAAFHERSRGILADLEDAESSTSEDSGAARGLLRVTMPLSFGQLHLAPLIQEFVRSHPNLELHVNLGDARDDLVGEGFDVAIRIGNLPDSTLVARRLCPIRLMICASPDYWDRHGRPLRPEDLMEHQALVHSHVDGAAYWNFGGEPALRVRLNVRMRANSGELLRDAAINGMGVINEPTFIIYDALKSGELEPVLLDSYALQGAAYAVFPPSRHLPHKARLFIDFLAASLAGTPSWDQGL